LCLRVKIRTCFDVVDAREEKGKEVRRPKITKKEGEEEKTEREIMRRTRTRTKRKRRRKKKGGRKCRKER
jgi:hypothetical protein